MTKEQVQALQHGDILHYTGKRPCNVTIGPRGGQVVTVTRVRVSGQFVEKKRTGMWWRPIKHGLRESAYIEPSNLADWHKAADCPCGINW